MMISIPIAYFGSALMVPLFLIALFGMLTSAPFEMGIMILCALPGGFLLAVKLSNR